ncbi:hypothetical protein Y032_0192g1366 [Ancylostoma ceylanicum]|uniref:Uncharacterized protein n=1 Tax=Ancylostoma ceylanicum TaxID=53326 RepID=A0A016SPK7_9BILA|nr:hypothetical protein Y032_0192g1366 [Ancylostoma ceylanicum]
MPRSTRVPLGVFRLLRTKGEISKMDPSLAHRRNPLNQTLESPKWSTMLFLAKKFSVPCLSVTLTLKWKEMILVLGNRCPQEICDGVEADKRERIIVIFGLEEWGKDKPLLERQRHLEESVADILDTLKDDCLSKVTYRMGKYNYLKPDLSKFYCHPSRIGL